MISSWEYKGKLYYRGQLILVGVRFRPYGLVFIVLEMRQTNISG